MTSMCYIFLSLFFFKVFRMLFARLCDFLELGVAAVVFIASKRIQSYFQ